MAKTFPGEPVPAARARPNAVVFGTRVAPYHPLGGVEAVFRTIFGRDFALRFTEDAGELAGGLADVRLVIAYSDVWDKPAADDAAAGLAEYVRQGGGLLVLHNGICWAKHTRVRALVGAVFTGHPEPAVLDYRFAGPHPLIAGLADFALREEPYRYDFEAGAAVEVFLHYEHEGRPWPAGWARTPGAGRVVNLQPGHRPAAFDNPGYAALVRRGARWCARLD